MTTYLLENYCNTVISYFKYKIYVMSFEYKGFSFSSSTRLVILYQLHNTSLIHILDTLHAFYNDRLNKYLSQMRKLSLRWSP
jgi:hypothetical protein